MAAAQTISYAEAVALADRLAAASMEKAAIASAMIGEAENADRASKLIRAMLKQTHSSDIFVLPSE